MSHMVIYRGADGKPGYQQAEDIHDAVTFVEQMRNEEGVEHARIFRLEEVTFEYRPYYRVELAGLGSAGGSLPSSNGMAASLPNGNGAPLMVGLSGGVLGRRRGRFARRAVLGGRVHHDQHRRSRRRDGGRQRRPSRPVRPLIHPPRSTTVGRPAKTGLQTTRAAG